MMMAKASQVINPIKMMSLAPCKRNFVNNLKSLCIVVCMYMYILKCVCPISSSCLWRMARIFLPKGGSHWATILLGLKKKRKEKVWAIWFHICFEGTWHWC